MQKRIWICATGSIGLNAINAFLALHRQGVVHVAGITTHAIEAPHAQSHEMILKLAQEHSLSCNFSKQLPEAIWQKETAIDYIFAIKWRYMIPFNLSQKPMLIIFHASPLPKRRGFAPVQWALLLGEKQSAVSMFFAADEVDSGPLLAQEWFEIKQTDKAKEVDFLVEHALLKLITEKTPMLFANKLLAEPQQHEQATYVPWLDEEDAHINWQQNGSTIINHQRAFSEPYYKAYTYFGNNEKLYPTSMRFIPLSETCYEWLHPGKLVAFTPEGGLQIACLDGLIAIDAIATEPTKTPKEVVKKLKTRFY